jgi:hypothetical protein
VQGVILPVTEEINNKVSEKISLFEVIYIPLALIVL